MSIRPADMAKDQPLTTAASPSTADRATGAKPAASSKPVKGMRDDRVLGLGPHHGAGGHWVGAVAPGGALGSVSCGRHDLAGDAVRGARRAVPVRGADHRL